ncbi:MAG: hypothetical protein KC548_02500 [Nanoarchaeota archaeon]|nr:hypothetical protein [Nanoarchaeota archaeon]
MRVFNFFSAFLLCLVLSFAVHAVTYNEGGDFKVEVSSQRGQVYNDNISQSFSFTVENLLQVKQEFDLDIPESDGWDIVVPQETFFLASHEKKTIQILFRANSAFDYRPSGVSPDLIILSQKDEYEGLFEFPVLVEGSRENVSMKFEVKISKPPVEEESFVPQFSSSAVSVVDPLRFSVRASGVSTNEESVQILVENAGAVISDELESFSEDASYKIFEVPISAQFSPGFYTFVITVRKLSANKTAAKEWYAEKVVEVREYVQVVESREEKKTLLSDGVVITLKNEGNSPQTYTEKVSFGALKSLFFSSSEQYEDTSTGVLIHKELAKGEEATIEYHFNYLSLYVFLLLLAGLFSYLYVRKVSNPLDVETKIYDVRHVEHEGVKSLKIQIGFENIKDEQIEKIKLVFRLPSYLSIKEGSFLLTEPNFVLKGKNQYKLVWDFKNFSLEDSRVIGFTLVNKRGVLGDIRLPDVEFELKTGVKQRRYYKGFPVIKG